MIPSGNQKVYIVLFVTDIMPKKLKKVELVILTEAYQKVLSWFFSFPNIEMSLNELSSDLEISKTTAKKIVEILAGEGFLIKKIYGKTWRITCNKDHPYNYTRKIAFNLEMVYEAYLKGLKEAILKNVGSLGSVILFGSYRKGDDTEKSDIDIAVEVFNNQDIEIIELGIISQFGYRKDIPVNLYIFSRNKVDLNLFSNIVNGIVIEGFLEVRT